VRTGGWKRGALVLLYKNLSLDFIPKLAEMSDWTAPYSLNQVKKCNSEAAVKLCKNWVKDNDGAACCFPASNGAEWIDLFLTSVAVEQLEPNALLPTLEF